MTKKSSTATPARNPRPTRRPGDAAAPRAAEATAESGASLTTTAEPEDPVAEAKRTFAVLKRAQSGDEAALRAARALFERSPDLRDRVGSLARLAEERWLATISSDPLIRQAMELQLADLRKRLAGPEPAPLEQVLIERIVMCWLECTYWSHQTAARYGDGGTSVTVATLDYKRQAVAEARFLAAVKTLGQVRRLLSNVPALALQVNIGTDQPAAVRGGVGGRAVLVPRRAGAGSEVRSGPDRAGS